MSKTFHLFDAENGTIRVREDDVANAIQASQAASLKRIADALWGTNQHSGILSLLAFMEENARGRP